jgi:hypothetical protein
MNNLAGASELSHGLIEEKTLKLRAACRITSALPTQDLVVSGKNHLRPIHAVEQLDQAFVPTPRN